MQTRTMVPPPWATPPNVACVVRRRPKGRWSALLPPSCFAATESCPAERLAIRRALCNPGSVRRAVLVAFLALLTFDVSGLAALCEDAACDETCPTDASGGQCPPNCHACTCCSLPKATRSLSVALVEPQAAGASWVGTTAELSSPEPADILHVPKPPLASS